MKKEDLLELHNGYAVESVFEHKGLWCAVLLQHLGHRCGYVGVPKTHKDYGKGYEDIGDFISCHGGLTFSSREEFEEYPSKDHTDLWWFGWDYAHYMDSHDYETAKSYWGKDFYEHLESFDMLFHTDGYISTLEDVIEECKQVAEQFAERG